MESEHIIEDNRPVRQPGGEEQLRLENEKLTLEIKQLKLPKPWMDQLAKFVPLVTVIIAFVGLWFSNKQFRDHEASQTQHELSQTLFANQTQLFEAQKPFLDKQLQQYFDASDAAAKVATAKNLSDKAKAESQFWALYWGPLAVVEDASISKPSGDTVESAMISFGNCLKGTEVCSDNELNQRSLNIAHRCRASISDS